MITIENKEKCCGCSACVSICPVNCLQMQMDEEGFYYPVANTEACINCNRCEKVCPYLADHADMRAKTRAFYGCQHPDDMVRMKSTSGGGFSILAEEIISRNGVVFGAAYDDTMHVIHKGVESMQELDQLRRSKYVQSDLQDTFSVIRSLLKEGRTVLFVGTPCQTEGLLMLLGGKAENLYTAEVKCYGVPSPGLFDRFQAYLKEYYHAELEDFLFRDKKYGYFGVNIKAVFKNGTYKEDQLVLKTYSKTMFSKVGLRRSCYECAFRSKEKLCDFTIGDIWTIKDYDPGMDDDIGTTLLEIHSEKGKQLFDEIIEKTNIKYVKIRHLEGEELVKYRAGQDVSYPLDEERRRAFFEDMHDMAYPDLMKKHFPDTMKNRIDNVMKPMIHMLPGSEKIFRKKKLK